MIKNYLNVELLSEKSVISVDTETTSVNPIEEIYWEFHLLMKITKPVISW